MHTRRWYELPFEVGLILFSGLLAYTICRSVYRFSGLAAIATGALAMLGLGLITYLAHRLRATHLEPLPLEESAALAWRLARHGLLAGLLGLLAAGFGFLAIYLIWQGNLVLGFLTLVASLGLGLLALLVIRRGWPKASLPD